jgi:integrase
MKRVPEDIRAAYIKALARRGGKYVILFEFGTATGLRISDILKLMVCDIKPRFEVTESKTKKKRTMRLSSSLVKKIKAYVVAHGLSRRDFFIYSHRNAKGKALSRVQAYRVMRSVASEMGFKHIGPHSMRKEYAMRVYRRTGCLKSVQEALGHKYIETTIGYLVDVRRIFSEEFIL